MSDNAYHTGLEKNDANYVSLSPLSFIRRSRDVFSDHPAVIYGDRRYTWRQSYERCVRLASALHRLGTGVGDTVTVIAANTHIFERVCTEHRIDHRCTKIKHPWTNGQVERMNRTIKEATVKRYYYDNHNQLKKHLDDFINAYNYGRRLKTLKGLTPYEFICKCWINEPERFNLDPARQMPGLNI